MRSAIVLDGYLKSALCVVRSLGRQGIPVAVGAERRTAMARCSKYTQHTFLYASPYRYPDLFLEHLKEAAEQVGGKPVVYAFSDATVLLFSRHREELAEIVTLVLASEDATETVFDKARTYELAQRLQVPTITTYTPQRETDLAALPDLSYPVVIKTRHSVAWKEGKGVFGTASFVHSAERLLERFIELHDTTGEAPLVQQFIKGEEYGVECLCKDGKAHVVVIHKRLRSMSPTGGASVLKETVGENELTKKMRAYAEKLLKELSWTGVAMVEFKVDTTDNTPKLMEINGRFWGSLPLAVFAGVDFPYLYYQLANGTVPQKQLIAEPGIVSEHVLGSLRWLGRVMFARDPMREVLYPSRMEALTDFLLPRRFKNDVWSFADVRPGFMELVDVVFSRIVKR